MRSNVCPLLSLALSLFLSPPPSFVIDYFHSRVTICFRSRVNKHFPSRRERAFARYEILLEKRERESGMIETGVDIPRDVCFSVAFISAVCAADRQW